MEHAFGLEIPLTLAEVCHPQRTAILVYDVQVGIVSQIADGNQVLERVRGVLEAARNGGYRVFFTRHMSLPNEVAGITQLRTAMAWQHLDQVDKGQAGISPGHSGISDCTRTCSAAQRGSDRQNHDVGLRGNLSRHRPSRLWN
jgi:Isochorismatase family